MFREHKTIQEALLQHIGYKTNLPIFRRFKRESIKDLIKVYSSHSYPGGGSTACGFVCAKTYNIIRSSDEMMCNYCKKFRAKDDGQTC